MKINKLKFLFLIICIFQIAYIFQSRSGFKFEVIKNPFSHNSGIMYALSPEVIESKNIVQNFKLSDFNLSKPIKNDTYLYQRFIEYNYPTKINEESEFIILLEKEKVPNNCELKESKKYLKLIKCQY